MISFPHFKNMPTSFDDLPDEVSFPFSYIRILIIKSPSPSIFLNKALKLSSSILILKGVV
ncbi:hypothetical protein CK503_14805 [Aliifodinibius salipaludis]|uniref:Uncharacterized protein n=1 Tax=Fodinibius salipaludis TaxID=2032627 RepID=A0A2A2G7C6_9BACT|nr:hypothetical protein CK503_14805 [Aliifodinibius salipaludis]